MKLIKVKKQQYNFTTEAVYMYGDTYDPHNETNETCAALRERLKQRSKEIDETIKQYGKLDGLINSAYRAGDFKEIEDSDFNDWHETMNTNFFGTMNLTMAAVKEMTPNKNGAIVMINSLITKKPLPTQGGYAASKGALSTATKILAKELGPKGIRVNSVYMGWMWGPPVEMYVNFTADSMGVEPSDVISGVTKDIPLGIIPDDSDCANAALFLISDLAKVITGANLDVNGGEFMS